MTWVTLHRLQHALRRNAFSFLVLLLYVFTVMRVTCVLVSSTHASSASVPARTCSVLFPHDKSLAEKDFQNQVAFWILTMMVTLMWAVMTLFIDYDVDMYDSHVRFIYFIRHEMRV